MTEVKQAVKAVKPIRLPKKVAEGSLAGKIRFLDEKGMARADIARQLGIRYQRVRNVLVPRVKPQDTEIESTSTEPTETPSEVLVDEEELVSQAS
jgi:hypothetical protein